MLSQAPDDNREGSGGVGWGMVASVYQTRAGTPRAKMLCHTVHQFIFLSATNFDFAFFLYLKWQVKDFYESPFLKTVFHLRPALRQYQNCSLFIFPGDN